MISIPSRFKVGFLGALACSLVYSLRVNLSVAIIAMVNQTVVYEHPNDMCPDYFNHTFESKHPVGKYKWTDSEQGIVLGAYFYTYTVTQISGGRFTERWGGKWVCGLGIMIPAIVNALSPVAADHSLLSIIAIRIIIGAFHGLVYSSLFSMYAKWFPRQERTAAVAATLFGGNIGAAIISPLAGYLCESELIGGWPSVFYVGSLIHVVWFIFWWYYVYDSPADLQNINPDEHLYILQNIECQTNKSKASAPWKSILTSPIVWASVFAKTSGAFGFNVLALNLPSYFHAIFNINISSSGVYTALTYLAIGITVMTAGPLSIVVQTKLGFSLTKIRKLFQTLASLGPAICIALVPVVECNVYAVIALFVVSMCLYGLITGGEYPIIPEFAPEFTGTVYGLTNSFASSTGFLAPYIVGVILDSDSTLTGTRKKWNLVFYITAAVYVIGVIPFISFASAERQPWDKLTDVNEIELDHFRGSNQEKNRKLPFFNLFNITSKKRSRKVIDTNVPEWQRFKKMTYVL